MSTIYQRKIRGFISSKNQDLFNVFAKDFLNTTRQFEDIKVYVTTTDLVMPDEKFIANIHPPGVFGNIAEKELLKKELDEEADVFLALNDDTWLIHGWLEDIINKLDEGFLAVSAGVSDTDNRDAFNKYIEQTKDDLGHEKFIHLVCVGWSKYLFKEIGLPDSQYSGCCDDMDWIWRLIINKVNFCSLRRIRVAHLNVGATRGGDLKDKYDRDMALHSRFVKAKAAKRYFQSKHGYSAYRNTERFMKNNQYYRKFIKLNGKT